MWPVPAWLKDVPMPSAEEFAEMDRRASKRQLEADAIEAASWRRPAN